MNFRYFHLCLGFLLATAFAPVSANSTYVRFNTNLGAIDVELLTDAAPATVANFLAYANSGAYNNSFFHRSVAGFVIQGGGYYHVGNDIYAVTANAAIKGEHGVSNTRGTLAMALSTGPDSATSEWFFNEGDNSAALDGTADGGPFTVFGRIANTSSLAVMDLINSEPTYGFQSPFNEIPLVNYDSSAAPLLQNFITISSITPLTDYVTWQTTHFAGKPTTVSGPSATPQNDGVTNMVKYISNIDPTVPMTAADVAKLPAVGSTKAGGVTYQTLTYRLLKTLVGVTVNVQTSTDLKIWTTAGSSSITQTGTDSSTGDLIMQAQVPIVGNRQFIRLNVTQP